ncbi:unnamed protein product, partial [Symbiodinium sp. CCMP2456]
VPVAVRAGACVLHEQPRLASLPWWPDFISWWEQEIDSEISAAPAARLCATNAAAPLVCAFVAACRREKQVTQVRAVPLSCLVAMLYYHGADATTAVADQLLVRAGEALMQHAVFLMQQGQQMVAAPTRSKWTQIDRYEIENLLLSLDTG